MGSTSSKVYIFFTCDNAVTIYWGKQLTPSQSLYNIPTYISPINLMTNVGSVKIFTNLPPTAIEGKPLPWNPVVQVLGKI